MERLLGEAMSASLVADGVFRTGAALQLPDALHATVRPTFRGGHGGDGRGRGPCCIFCMMVLHCVEGNGLDLCFTRDTQGLVS